MNEGDSNRKKKAKKPTSKSFWAQYSEEQKLKKEGAETVKSAWEQYKEEKKLEKKKLEKKKTTSKSFWEQYSEEQKKADGGWDSAYWFFGRPAGDEFSLSPHKTYVLEVGSDNQGD